jgi:hypothetical protein
METRLNNGVKRGKNTSHVPRDNANDVFMKFIREFTIYDAAGSTTRSKFQLKNER